MIINSESASKIDQENVFKRKQIKKNLFTYFKYFYLLSLKNFGNPRFFFKKKLFASIDAKLQHKVFTCIKKKLNTSIKFQFQKTSNIIFSFEIKI